MSSLSFFPTATDELMENANVRADEYEFNYYLDGRFHRLEQKGKRTIKLTDPLELWNVVDDGLQIRRHISIEYPNLLKGKDGIAPTGATIGVCIIWCNKDLTQMGYIKPQRFSQNGADFYDFKYDFAPGELSGNLSLDTVFYLETPDGNVSSDELGLMNRAGVTLGEIDSISVNLSSEDMLFPIVEIDDKNAPLWWLELNQWDDPTVDPFSSDYVCLYLNNAYSCCPKAGSKTKDQELLIEIISTAYLLMFQELINRDCIDKTLNDIGLEPGSIAKVLYYFSSSCDPALRTETPASLQRSIRINIERMLKEEDDEL